MRKTYQITEYGSFTRDKPAPGCVALPPDTFDALEDFVLSNRDDGTSPLELMGLSARKGVGRLITAKNYVGVIAMNSGTAIEILPKICSCTSTAPESAKKLLIDMLRTLRQTPFKTLHTANVNIDRLSILEIFIRMFLEELFRLVKYGLPRGYRTTQSNENQFKGKIVFPEHIRCNYAHKERSFVEYDTFSADRPENRILKSTLRYLYQHTVSLRSKTDIRTLLGAFSEVSESRNVQADFARIVPDRKNAELQTALLWSRVFLQGKSFSAFSGADTAFSLLFPMETLFESYIAAHLHRLLAQSDYVLSVQDKTYHLFDEPKKFLLKPDIVLRNRISGQVLVMDTKWKLLSDSRPNAGISQADMYQMFAYQKKYAARHVTLLYPRTETADPSKIIRFSAQDGAEIRVRFVDLFDAEHSLEGILADSI